MARNMSPRERHAVSSHPAAAPAEAFGADAMRALLPRRVARTAGGAAAAVRQCRHSAAPMSWRASGLHLHSAARCPGRCRAAPQRQLRRARARALPPAAAAPAPGAAAAAAHAPAAAFARALGERGGAAAAADAPCSGGARRGQRAATAEPGRRASHAALRRSRARALTSPATPAQLGALGAVLGDALLVRVWSPEEPERHWRFLCVASVASDQPSAACAPLPRRARAARGPR
jgi:hypothetical protein